MVTVTPGPLDHFTIANIVDQVAGTPFNATATAYDQFNNVKTDYSGGATLSGNLGIAPDSSAPSYGSFGTWASGAASASVTAFNAESGRSVTATDGSATGTSNSFTVAPGPIDHFTFATIPGPGCRRRLQRHRHRVRPVGQRQDGLRGRRDTDGQPRHRP